MSLYDSYFDSLQSSFSSLPRRMARRWLKTHEHPRVLYTLLKSLPAGAKLLDVGCGPCNNLRIFNSYRDDIYLYGLDFNVANVDGEIGDLALVQADPSKSIPFPAESFDLVVSYFVLEHIETSRLDAFCESLANVVKPGGHLFLTFPNEQSLKHGFYDDPTHVRPYTAFSVNKLFAPRGFKHVSSGKDRSFKILMLSPFYQLMSLFRRDNTNINFFTIHLLGTNSYYLGRKLDDTR